MNQEELFALLDRFERGSCTQLKLSMKDVSLELSKLGSAVQAAPAARAGAPAAAAPAEAPEGCVVTAPLVGTYYAAPGPDQPPFVKVGDRVEKGRTLCLLEAMKMMSEVPAPCDLEVEALLCENGQMVEFGAPILRYREL